MKNKHLSSITEYINWLIKEYLKVKAQTTSTATYRLVDNKENDAGKIELIAQVIGKNTTVKFTPEEILADDELTELFSSKDIRTITYYACQPTNKPKSRLVLKRFCEKLNRMVFGVSHVNKEEVEEKTSKEISLDKNLIKNLSPEDAHTVGFVTASENEHDKEKERLSLKSKGTDKKDEHDR